MKNIIETDRLVLREITTNDAPFILALLNTDGWLQYIGDRNVRTIADAEKYITERFIKSYFDHGFGLYLVALKSNNASIGMCGLIKRESLEDVDIGFAFLPEFTGLGYAYEAALATLKLASGTLNLKRILAITTPDNTSSIKLVEKIGLQFEKKILFEEKEELFLFGISDLQF